MTRRARLLVPVCTAAVFSLVACGGTSSSPGDSSSASTQFSTSLGGTLTVSGFNPSDDVGRSRSQVATQKVSPVSVSFDATSFDAKRFSAQVDAGTSPDLVVAPRAAINSLADQKLIVPLDSCYKVHDVDPNERFYQAPVQDVTYDGHIYGIPQFFEPSLIVGDATVMNAAGVTVSDLDTSKPDRVLAATGQMAKSSGGTLSVMGFDAGLPDSTGLWLGVFGGRLHDESGKPTLDNANNAKALTFLKQLVDAQGGYSQVSSLASTFGTRGSDNPFVAHRVGAQTWTQAHIAALGTATTRMSISPTTIKTLDGNPLGYGTGTAFAIPAAAHNKDAACAWALQATSPEAWDAAADARQATLARTNGVFTGLFTGSPVADQEIRTKYVKPTGSTQVDELVATSYDSLTNTLSADGSPISQQITAQLGIAAEQVLRGQKSPAVALKDAQTAALLAWGQTNIGRQK